MYWIDHGFITEEEIARLKTAIDNNDIIAFAKVFDATPAVGQYNVTAIYTETEFRCTEPIKLQCNHEWQWSGSNDGIYTVTSQHGLITLPTDYFGIATLTWKHNPCLYQNTPLHMAGEQGYADVNFKNLFTQMDINMQWSIAAGQVTYQDGWIGNQPKKLLAVRGAFTMTLTIPEADNYYKSAGLKVTECIETDIPNFYVTRPTILVPCLWNNNMIQMTMPEGLYLLDMEWVRWGNLESAYRWDGYDALYYLPINMKLDSADVNATAPRYSTNIVDNIDGHPEFESQNILLDRIGRYYDYPRFLTSGSHLDHDISVFSYNECKNAPQNDYKYIDFNDNVEKFGMINDNNSLIPYYLGSYNSNSSLNISWNKTNKTLTLGTQTFPFRDISRLTVYKIELPLNSLMLGKTTNIPMSSWSNLGITQPTNWQNGINLQYNIIKGDNVDEILSYAVLALKQDTNTEYHFTSTAKPTIYEFDLVTRNKSAGPLSGLLIYGTETTNYNFYNTILRQTSWTAHCTFTPNQSAILKPLVVSNSGVIGGDKANMQSYIGINTWGYARPSPTQYYQDNPSKDNFIPQTTTKTLQTTIYFDNVWAINNPDTQLSHLQSNWTNNIAVTYAKAWDEPILTNTLTHQIQGSIWGVQQSASSLHTVTAQQIKKIPGYYYGPYETTLIHNYTQILPSSAGPIYQLVLWY